MIEYNLSSIIYIMLYNYYHKTENLKKNKKEP